MKSFVFLLLAFSGSLFAQQLSHPVMASRDDSFLSPRSLRAFPDTINVLAVMVQFSPDADGLTSGNGQFVLSSPGDSIIDAPPRNRGYFQDHLTFLQNYFGRTSRGKLVVRSTVVDTVFTLPNVMAAYSPPRNGSNVAVANLARETWQSVDASGRVPDFSVYNCFVVFHAGVGRDIDLVSLFGYDPTPFDIPSLYFGLNAFRQFFGTDYEGIPVNGGSFHITNSIIMPETENRELPATGGGTILLELGINGLLCASMGSHLGLPDLFDTNTGNSGIGRFGLMDGQSIFSFFGVFPPEPSAWEKYWLGWIAPIVVVPADSLLSLPAVSLADTVYRLPVSAREYFLIENRNRDALRNGQTVTSVFNGVAQQRTFLRDTTRFNAFNISDLSGTITDVEDFDWSLPGGVDNAGNFFDGGVLIWHIDEAIIAQNIRTNGVNANPERRGVDLEEADGSQDIGQEYGFLDPGSGSEEGTPLDFWFAGNASPVFKNIFSATSFPNSSGNNGANSHVTVKGFGPRGPAMSVTVSRGDAQISALNGFPKETGEMLSSPSLTVTVPPAGTSQILVASTGIPVTRYSTSGVVPSPLPVEGKLFSWNSDGTPTLPSGSVFASTGITGVGFLGSPAVRDLNGNTIVEVVVPQGPVSDAIAGPAAMRAFSDSNGSVINHFSTSTARAAVTPPVIGDSIIAFGAKNGWTYFLRFDGSVIDSVNVSADSSSVVTGISRFLGGNQFVITASDGSVFVTTRSTNGVVAPSDRLKGFGGTIVGPAAAGMFGPAPSARIALVTADGLLHLVDAGLEETPGFPVSVGGAITGPPALADVDGDGLRDIVLFSGFRVYAYNHTGALLDYFPITVRSSKPLTSSPVIADFNGDGNVEVVAVSGDGLVVAYDKTGRMAPGFPLQAGTGSQTAALVDVPSPLLGETGIGLVVVSSEDGSISGWRTGAIRVPGPLPNRPWPQYGKDAQHSGLAIEPLTGSPLSSEFFPKDRAYNWPNPVNDGRTFIRYFIKQDATVNVKVFDLAGDLVTEFAGPGIGGVDNEIAWNVSGIQSGIYFARIEANGSGGSGVAVVKVAVVK